MLLRSSPKVSPSDMLARRTLIFVVVLAALLSLITDALDLQRLLVVRQRLDIHALVQERVGQVEMGVRHAWIEAGRLLVSLDRQIDLLFAPIRQAEVVVPPRAVRVEGDPMIYKFSLLADKDVPAVCPKPCHSASECPGACRPSSNYPEEKPKSDDEDDSLSMRPPRLPSP